MGEKVNSYRVLMGNPEGKRPLGRHSHRDIGGRIILRSILEKLYGVVWTGLMGLEIGTGGGLL
jgi:hypothetical protein